MRIVACGMGLFAILSGIGGILGGWIITPAAFFGWVLFGLGVLMVEFSRGIADWVTDLFVPVATNTPVANAPAANPFSGLESIFTTVAAVGLNDLAALDAEIQVKCEQRAAAIQAAEQQNNAKAAAVNREAQQIKAMKAKVPNAA
jgi:hypothetical protein